jgi:signal peptidase I
MTGLFISYSCLALGLIIVPAMSSFQPYQVTGSAMTPTLRGDDTTHSSDRILILKAFAQFRDFQRWDIAVFKTEAGDADHKTLVQRIVALPGERVEIRSGELYINDDLVSLPTGLEYGQHSSFFGTHGATDVDKDSRVPEGYYLVLGDNGALSRDGRSFGWTPEEEILGRVLCILSPEDRIRWF